MTITNETVERASTSRRSLAGVDSSANTFPREPWYAVYPNAVFSNPSRTFADEREAFRSALPLLLSSEYAGEWVAISGGRVTEHDRDRKAVTLRFFQNRTRGPVYIGFVGHNPVAHQATPFRARPRA